VLTLEQQIERGLIRVGEFTAASAADAEWPAPLGKAAYHGLVGKFAHAVEPHTEGDPAAILIQTLVLIGNALGRGPHFIVEDDRHGTNLHLAIVGNTALARKGTSLGRSWRFVSLADPSWAAANDGEGGLSTAEGLISAVRDSSGSGKEHQSGVIDKRLLAMISEFAETLSKMKREGNTLGATIRSAWDGKTLRIRTRNRPLTATNAHVSILGHITRTELRALLTQTDMFNGFGNRFLWVVAARSKKLADPTPFRVDELKDLIADLHKSILWAEAEDRELAFDARARAAWAKLYGELGYESDDEESDGHFDAITARAAPLIRRLALIYAAIDRSSEVTVKHLAAGLEVWRYCEQSAAYLFAGEAVAAGLEGRIERQLQRRGGWVGYSALYAALEPAKTYYVRGAIERLVARGVVEERTVDTGGRPRREYRVTGR
jgi:hypothetical protein